MPRVHIQVPAGESIEEFEEREDWESRVAMYESDARRNTRREPRSVHAEAHERRRAERRKQVVRSGRRLESP